MKGLSEAHKRAYNNYGMNGVNAYFKPTTVPFIIRRHFKHRTSVIGVPKNYERDCSTLRQILVSPKDKTEKKDITDPIYVIFVTAKPPEVNTRYFIETVVP